MPDSPLAPGNDHNGPLPDRDQKSVEPFIGGLNHHAAEYSLKVAAREVMRHGADANATDLELKPSADPAFMDAKEPTSLCHIREFLQMSHHLQPAGEETYTLPESCPGSDRPASLRNTSR